MNTSCNALISLRLPRKGAQFLITLFLSVFIFSQAEAQIDLVNSLPASADDGVGSSYADASIIPLIYSGIEVGLVTSKNPNNEEDYIADFLLHSVPVPVTVIDFNGEGWSYLDNIGESLTRTDFVFSQYNSALTPVSMMADVFGEGRSKGLYLTDTYLVIKKTDGTEFAFESMYVVGDNSQTISIVGYRNTKSVVTTSVVTNRSGARISPTSLNGNFVNVDSVVVSNTGSGLDGGFDTFNFTPPTDLAPPDVKKVFVAGTPSANATSIDYTVSFYENANNLSTDDFELTKTGTAEGTISAISASSGTSVNVIVNSISGDGTLRLDIKSNTNITDDNGNGNNNNGYVAAYTGGATHAIDFTAPVFTSATTANFAENGTGTAYTVAATDANTVTYSLGNAKDEALFNIVGATGVVTFKNAPNFESPTDGDANNTYVINVIANDGNNSANQEVTITVTNVNENPSITSTAVTAVNDNATYIYDITTSDLDNDVVTLTATTKPNWLTLNATSLNIIGSGSIGATDGSASSASFNTPYDLALDASGNLIVVQYGGSKIRKISPRGVVSSITATSGGVEVSFSGATGMTIDGAGNIYVVYFGGLIKKVTPEGLVTTITSGLNSLTDIVIDSDGLLYASSQNAGLIYKITAGGTVTTLASGFGQITSLAIDGSSNIYASRRLAGEIDKVTPAGAKSTVVSGLGSVNGIDVDASGNIYAVKTGSEVIKITPGGTTTTLMTGITGGNGLEVSASGKIYVASYTGHKVYTNLGNIYTVSGSAVGQSGNHNVTLSASDGNGGTDTQTFTIAVADATNPVFTSATTANFAENGTGTAYTVAATDANTITYSLGTAKDEALFNIVGATGVVTFKNAPNFESPTDGDANNTYVVNVIANDGTNSVNQDVIITVTNVNEAPSITSTAVTAVNDNETYSYKITTSDLDNDAVTVSATVKPDWLTLVTGNGGVITLSGSAEGHAGKHNVTLLASDGNGGTATQSFVIDVSRVLTPDANNILYVNKSVSGGNGKGGSWANAVTELADALVWAKENYDNAWATTPLQIWVAGGTYKPLYTPEDGKNFAVGTDPRDNAFLLVNNVELYGGFAGTEAALSDRDLSLTANATILSGDFNDNDVVTGTGSSISFSGNTENAYHVIISAGPVGKARLDGFTVTNANANGSNSITVNAISFIRNYGGGMFIDASSPSIYRSIFVHNYSSDYGSGIFNNHSAAPEVNYSIFKNNKVGSCGAAMYNYNSSSPTITNSLFTGNSADDYGGAIYNSVTSSSTLVNSTIVGNSADSEGAGIYINNSTASIHNSIIWNEIDTDNGGTYSAKNSIIQGSSDLSNGNIDASRITVRDLFTDSANSDYTLKNTSPAVNAGDNALYTGTLATDKDLAGNPRLFDGAPTTDIIDMGAYEYHDIIDPVLTSVTTTTFAENSTGTAYTVTATDDNTITYSLGTGNDEALFNIVGATGVVTFKTSPDYEVPTDGNTDNAYVINVIASDGKNTANQNVTISVTDVDEIKPTVTITSASTSPNSGALGITVTFSESVTGFVVGDLTVANGTASNFAGSGTTYTATITPSADGAVTVDVAAGVAQDAAANTNTAATQLSIINDETKPTVTVTSASTSPNSGAFGITVTFSESVTGFVVGDLTVVNGTASNFAGSGTTYTATITPSADGAVTVDVAAGVAQDAAANTNTAATQLSIINDETKPTVTVTSASTSPNSGAFGITVTFSESVTGFVVGDLTVVNGTASNFAGSGTTYTATITPSADGAVTVDVAAGVAQDAATNTNTAATQFSITNDETKPTVTIASSSTSPTSGAFNVTITFSESVTGFVIGDLTVANGAASNFAGSGTTYTATITPSADGAVTVDVAAGVAQDAASNTNTAAIQFSITNDETKPSVTIASASTSPTSGAFNVTITFNESVTGFVVGDLTVVNGTASNFAGSGTTYTATITPSADGAVTVNVAAGVAQDAASNTNTAATQFSITNDETKPTVTVTSASTSPNSGAFGITVTFSESVTGFVVGDLTVASGTASNFAGSGATYTATITPSADGAVTVDVAAGVAQDAASNTNTAATQFSITNDETKPTVTITSASTSPNSGAFDITVTFSESVTGFVVGDLTVVNGTASNFAGSGTTYTATITPSADGAVTVDVASGVAQDAASNTNTAATQFSITNDETKPTVTVTSSSTSPNSGAFDITVTFSESVTGFVVGDLTVANGVASNFAGSGTTYTATITPSADGVVTVDVAAGVAQDAATNTNTAATQFSITNDETKPTVTIASSSTSPTSGAFNVTITFSESVTGFVIGDLILANGTASNFAGSGTTYTATITPSADGVVTVNVAAGVAQDAATNTNTAATQFSITNDETKPTVTIASSSTSPTSGAFNVTITFSESVTGFVIGDLAVDNGTASNFVGSGTTYTATITPSADGAVTVDVAVGVAQDAATNTNTAAAPFSIINDQTKPSVTLSAGTTNPVAGLYSITAQFSEGVIGFSLDDIIVVGGTASNLVAVDADTYTFSVTSINSSVTVNIEEGVAIDVVGNYNTASNTLSLVFNLAPSGLTLSNTSISENNSIGQLIGNLSTTDADVSDTHTYSLVSGIGADDNSSFTVVRNKLQAAEVFDFEIKTTYNIRIKTDDGRGGTYEKQFTISITNIEEPEVRIESDYEIPATALGLTSNFDITIHNDGDALLMVNSVLYPDGFVGLVTGLFINPGESKVVTLGFMPTEAKVYTGTISFITNAGTVSMTVSGEGAIITGVDDGFIGAEEINLFPNPAQDILNIDLSELGSRALDISIVNASGIPIFTKNKVAEKTLRLNVSDYTNGLYIVQFTDGISVVRKKVMIKK